MDGVAGKRSAGLLLFRRSGADVEVLLAHMGGPLWAGRDTGAWTLPKGEYEPGEPPLQAADREFLEELGLPAPGGERLALGEVRQSGGKTVLAWAVEGDVDPAATVPGTFEMEWPPRSGRRTAFPEVDRVEWFTPQAAWDKIIAGQRPFLDRLDALLHG